MSDVRNVLKRFFISAQYHKDEPLESLYSEKTAQSINFTLRNFWKILVRVLRYRARIRHKNDMAVGTQRTLMDFARAWMKEKKGFRTKSGNAFETAPI